MEYAVEHAVGPDALGANLDGNTYVWVVTHYENYGYEGSGYGAALRKDGIVEIACLSHCSCNDPSDDWHCGSAEKIPLNEFLIYDEVDPNVPGRKRDEKDCDYALWKAICAKVRELQKVQ
jgi:hypothetical protein